MDPLNRPFKKFFFVSGLIPSKPLTAETFYILFLIIVIKSGEVFLE
jgi:hypothetical protein